MEVIFHEKQEGSLCAQHCLNALLQGSYFTPVDLASLAQQMDDEERIRMAESGVDTEEYRRFLEQPSGNYDDSGYFSVQVISSALEVWGLELVPYNSTEPRALEAQQCPEAMQAFICNYRDHWFTIRRLGYQWFNLNSLLTGPELISDTYLAMFLAQLQQEGYSIFVVFGPFPECDADTLLRIVPAVQTVKPRLLASAKSNNASNMGSSQNKSSEEDLQRAIKLSLGAQEELPPGQAGHTLNIRNETTLIDLTKNNQDDDDDVRKDLHLILRGQEEEHLPSTSQKTNRENDHDDPDDDDDDDEEAELQKALRLSLQSTSPGTDQEDLELERALKMSLECCDSSRSSNSYQASGSNGCDSECSSNGMPEVRSSTNLIDAEDVRRKRLAYLEANARRNTPTNVGSAENMKKQVNT